MDFTVQKRRLETRLSALSAGMLAGQGLTALMERRVEHASSVTKRTQIRAILTALDRLQDGEYGYCRICGADISADQLRDLPENPFCESCSG